MAISSNLSFLENSNGDVAVPGTTVSTSTSTGALTVAGGAGIGGALYAGAIYSNGTLVNVAGVAGPQGPSGVAGPTGPSGPSGAAGFVGSNGTNGATGPTGPQGPSGAASSVAGPTGPSGPTGAGVAGPQGPSGLTQISQEFTATAGQTVFTTTSAFTSGTEQVFANGIQLPSSDYTVSGGNTVTVGAARRVGDNIRILAAQSYTPGLGALTGGVAGAVPYQSAAGVTGFSAAGTAGQVFTSAGTGAPTWTTVGGGAAVADDTSTAATYYPLFATATSGTPSTIKVASTKLQFNPSTGTLFATVFQSLSDASLKTNVQPIVDAGAVVAQLQGVGYDWVDGTGGAQFGFIAQEVEKVIPAVVGSTGDLKTVNYAGIIPFLVEAIKELQARVAILEGK